MAMSVRKRIEKINFLLIAGEHHLSDLKSLDGARNPAASLDRAADFYRDLLEAGEHVGALCDHFSKQLERKGGA